VRDCAPIWRKSVRDGGLNTDGWRKAGVVATVELGYFGAFRVRRRRGGVRRRTPDGSASAAAILAGSRWVNA